MDGEAIVVSLRCHIRHYNRAPKPIKWTYTNPKHRISAIASTKRGTMRLVGP